MASNGCSRMKLGKSLQHAVVLVACFAKQKIKFTQISSLLWYDGPVRRTNIQIRMRALGIVQQIQRHTPKSTGLSSRRYFNCHSWRTNPNMNLTTIISNYTKRCLRIIGPSIFLILPAKVWLVELPINIQHLKRRYWTWNQLCSPKGPRKDNKNPPLRPQVTQSCKHKPVYIPFDPPFIPINIWSNSHFLMGR